MSPTIKAALIALPIALVVQGVLIVFAVSRFGEHTNFPLRSALGIGTGLVTYFSVRKHYQQRTGK